MSERVKSKKVISLKLNLPCHYLCFYDSNFKNADKLTWLDKMIHSLVINRIKLSMAYGKKGKMGQDGKFKCFYNPKGQYFYAVFSIAELRNKLPRTLYRGKLTKISKHKIEQSLQRLEDFGLITRIKKEHHNEIRSSIIDDFIASMPDNSAEYPIGTPQSTQSVLQYKGNERESKRNNKHINTVNTKAENQRFSASQSKATNKYKFKPMSKNDRINEMMIHQWGYTKDSAFQVMKFSVNNHQNPKVIIGLIKEARNSVAKANNISLKKSIAKFDGNKYIIDKMGNQLSRLFTYILDPNYKYKTEYSTKYVDITHYHGWFVKSMENFFTDAFGLNTPKVVSPQQRRKPKHHYNKEERALLSNKPEKLHRTPKKLQNKIKKQFKQMDEPKNQCNDSNTPKKSTSKTDNNVTMDNHSNSTKNSTEAKESKQKSTYKVSFTPKVTNKSGKIVKSEMGTGLFGNHPRIANKDIYTVIKSKLPDTQQVIINAQNGTKTVTLGQLKTHYDYKNKNIDKPFLKDVNKFTMMVYSEKRLDPLNEMA